MELKEAIETYGEQKIEEILDMIMLRNTNKEKWREIAINLGVVKKTTKTIKASVYKEEVKVELKRDEDGRLNWSRIDNPYYKMSLGLKNGRNQVVFELYFKTDLNGKIKGV